MNNSSGKSDQNISAQDQSMFDFRSQVVITSAVFIIAFIGNAFVIAVVKRKTKRPINDLFIVNLSVSDILFVGVCLISYIFLALKPGLFYCTAIRPLPTIAFCASIFTMTSMAVIRCRIMCYPHKPKVRKQRVYCWIFTIWLLSLIINLPTLLVAMVTSQGKCQGKWPSVRYKDAYIIGFLLLKVILPLIIITSAYVKIGLFLMKNKRPQTCLNENRALKYRHITRKDNIQIIRVLGAVIIMFGLCSAPHQIAWMLYHFGNKKEKEIGGAIFIFSTTLQTIHASINPFIYGIMSKHFRKEYMKILATLFNCFTCNRYCVERVVIENIPAEDLMYHSSRMNSKTKRSDDNERIINGEVSEEERSAHDGYSA
ncbi:galanin receptor type 1-like [Porites lutea]